ncbi:MAG: nucleotidyltransferase family protein [Bacteroidales bacterium]|nr:nucleotidyltransferase family protein [Bacteroidales bacterium]
MPVINELKNTQKIFLQASLIDDNDDNRRALLKTLFENITDWNNVVSFSLNHGIAPLLYKNIKKNNLTECLPDKVFSQLKNAYLTTFTKNTLASEALKEVLIKLNNAGIETVLLKGMAMAQFIYNDPGVRPMGDIDLVVHPEKLLETEEILFNLGYVNNTPYKSKKIRTLNIHNHLNAFVKNNVVIELHWDLFSVHHIYKIPANEIWKHLEVKLLENNKIHVLDFETTVQYLCLHSMSHFQKKKIRLNSFTDIAQLLINREDQINWKKFTQSCETFKIDIPVYNTLYIINQFFGIDIPDFILNKTDKDKSIITKDFLFLLDNETQKMTYRMPSDYFMKIASIKGIQNKISYLWAEVFPSKEYIIYAFKLKENAFVYPYYFIQFFVQIKKTLSNILGLIKRRI